MSTIKGQGPFCHSLLTSAADHLVMWADYAVPKRYSPETVLVHTLPPIFTLARSAIESAAQAIWMLSPEDPVKRTARYVTLATWDLNEQLKAAATEEARAELRNRRDPIFAALGVTSRTFRPPRYLDMIRESAEFLGLDEPIAMSSADKIERVWRAAAAAAHGKRWPDFEFYDRTDVDDEVVSSVPRVDAISDVLQVAERLLSAGVVLFAMRAGRENDQRRLWDEAAVRLGAEVTPQDSAHR